MTPEAVFFIVFAVGAIASSLGVVLLKQPINAAIALIMSFFFLAGVYILLNAHFLAVLQILVYAGAIMVLFIFVLMLLNIRDDDIGPARVNVTKLITVGILGGLLYVVASASMAFVGSGTRIWGPSLPETFGTVTPIGHALMTDYVLPFEMAAVLLLVGIVGAVVVAKRRL